MSKRKLSAGEGFVSSEQPFETPSDKKERYVFEEADGNKYRPYAISKTKRIPTWVKATFTKWWVPGMLFYFIYFGFGFTELLSGYLLALVFGLSWGLVTDVFVNHAFRGFDSEVSNYKDYIIFGQKRKLWTLPLNLLLGAMFAYIAIIEVITPIFGLIDAYHGAEAANDFMFFAGAFVYATVMLGLDMAAVGIKRLIMKLIKRRSGN